MTDLPLTKVAETDTTITLGWTPPPDVEWYTFYAAGQRVANAPPIDKTGTVKSTVKFAKDKQPFRVVANGPQAEGVYPPVAPPPPPPPPPSGGLLRKPPGYAGGDPKNPANFPGFVVVDVNAPGTYPASPDDNKDYFFRINVDQLAPTSGGRSAVYFRGGRHRVTIGPKVHLRSQSTAGDPSDPSGFILDDGNPAGITHIEGFDVHSANGCTIRTKQAVQLQYGRIEARAFQRNQSYTHPDPIQTWDRGPSAGIFCDYVTALSERTGWSVLMPPNPVRWENRHVQLIFDPDHSGPGVYYGNEKKTIWVGEDCWFKGGLGQCLDDSLAGWGTDNVAYRITRASDGKVYVNPESPNPPAGGNSPFGNAQGDRIDYPAIPQLAGMSWKFGTPSGGDFAPVGSVGLAYTPKGYR